jgi:hypothetical protein
MCVCVCVCVYTHIYYVFPCHDGVARPQIVDGGDGLQKWMVTIEYSE